MRDLGKRVEEELHEGQYGFKVIAGFASIDLAMEIAGGLQRVPGIADTDAGKDLPVQLSERDLVIDIVWSMTTQAV